MERRSAKWEGEKRQRRESAWDPGQPRQRRRPRWGEFRSAYPRVVTGMALGMLVLLAFDGWLLYKRQRYKAEAERLRAGMTDVERRRADMILASSENRAEVMMELAKRQAFKEQALSLAVDTEKSTMFLQREAAQLREMPVKIGPSLPSTETGSPPIVAPLGKRSVVRVLDGSHEWEVPSWVYTQRNLPVPGNRRVPGALGPVAILLDGGTVIYTTPRGGPLADESYVLPGNVRVRAEDLEAVWENLAPGMAVYFY